MVAYVPEKYFDRNIAEQEGDYINIMGIFNYTVQDIETGKNDGLRMFRFPSMFATRPYEVTKVKKLKLTTNSDPEDYRILRYRDDDQIIVSTKVIQFVGNCEKMLNLFFMLGYVINTIPYQNGINNQMFGFAISEVCRAKNDETKPFRLSGSKDMNAYKSMSLRNVSRLISPYTALISEDFDESVLAAMMNENPKDTPLEEILVGQE